MRYWLTHEKIIRQALLNKKAKINWPKLYAEHLAKIKLIQHERLIQLLVTLFFGAFSLISFFAFLILQKIEIVTPTIIFLATTLGYAIYYYRLEKITFRWYRAADDIAKKLK